MGSGYCATCGAEFTKEGSRFCAHCGAPRAQVPPSTGPGSPAEIPVSAEPAAAPVAHVPTTALIGGLPAELWLVIAAFAIPGAWLLVSALRALDDSLPLIDSTFFGWRLGLVLNLLVVLVAAIGVGMLAIAWMLYKADRVARGVAYVVGGTIVLTVLVSNDRSSAQVAALVGSLIAIAILAGSPNVRALFTGPDARHGEAPTSVIVCRTVLVIFNVVATLVAFIYLIVGTIQGRWLIVAALVIAMVVAAHTRSARLMLADRKARAELTIGAAVLAVLLLIFGKHSTGLVVPIGLISGAVGCLWLANDARRFFGDAPLGQPKAA